MAVFNEPTKWQTSLVNSGDANVIPQSTPVGTGEASFDDGFPQITQIPIGAGGIAPDRKDFNGLFKILGDWIFFAQNGGVSTYSENFDYVAGRVVSYNDNIYKCIQNNGVSSTVVTPDSDTAYWQRLDNFVRSVNGVDADASGNVTINAGFATPDYSASVSQALNTDYTAPSDGFIYGELSSHGDKSAYYILIDNTYVIGTTQETYDKYSDTYVIFMVPIKKGTQYRFVVTRTDDRESKVNFAPVLK